MHRVEKVMRVVQLFAHQLLVMRVMVMMIKRHVPHRGTRHGRVVQDQVVSLVITDVPAAAAAVHAGSPIVVMDRVRQSD